MKFSIIVASYNVSPYIAECIEGLKRQTFLDFEVILVDDASKDATLDVARLSAGDDIRFYYLELTKNSGQSVARNVGLEHARGEYVLFLDSDDYYREDALELIDKRINQNNLDQLFFSAETLYENRHLRRERYEDQENRLPIEGVMTGLDMYVEFEYSKSFRPSSCLFAIRRSIVENAHLRFKEGIIHEDLLFTMQTFPLTLRTEFINEPLYKRRMREGSTMTSAFSMRNVHGLFFVAQTLRSWLSEHSEKYGDAFCRAYTFRIADTYNVAARYLFEIRDEDVDLYRNKLDSCTRIDFDLYILEHFRCISGIYEELTKSRTYRLGRLFLAFPSWVKGFILPPK